MQPHTCYLVCATPRSGSTFLYDILNNTGIAGQPKEYFQPPIVRPQDYFETEEHTDVATLLAGSWPDSDPVEPAVWDGSDYADYLMKVLEKSTTPNGVFGAKVMWGHLDYFLDKLWGLPQYREFPAPDLLSKVFPNLHYIWIRRQEKLRQAVSLWKAIQTWTWKAGEPPKGGFSYPAREPLFHYEAIGYLLQQLLAHEAAWQQYFNANGIKPFTVVYEEWTSAYEATALNILQYLHIPIPKNLVVAEPPMQRQADALSEEWVRQYQAQKREREEKIAEQRSRRRR